MNSAIITKILARLSALESDLKNLYTLSRRSEIAGGAPLSLFVNLPSPTKRGAWVYVTDGRKGGEGPGAGTGVLALADTLGGVATWVRVDDPTQAVQV